jgi:hypothetical protein
METGGRSTSLNYYPSPACGVPCSRSTHSCFTGSLSRRNGGTMGSTSQAYTCPRDVDERIESPNRYLYSLLSSERGADDGG